MVTASAIAAAPAISPPLTPRDQWVVAQADQRISSENVDLVALSQPLVVEPASLLRGVALVDRVSGGTVPVVPLAAVQPDGGAAEQADRTALVVDEPADFFGGLLNAYLNGGSSAVTAYVALAVSDQVFGPDSVPSVLLGAYVKQGVVGVVGAVALLISDEVNGPDSEQSQSIADFLDGGVNKTIGKAFLAFSNEKFGEGSFASGLTSSFFFGYPDGEEGAPTGLGGVTRFVFTSLVEAINESINGPAVSTTGAVSLVSQKSTVAPSVEGSKDKVGVSVTNLVADIKPAAGAVERKTVSAAVEENTPTEVAGAALEAASAIAKVPEALEKTPKDEAESTEATDAEAEAAPKSAAEAENKAETKAGTTAETKVEAKTESKADSKTETKTEAKAETKADAKDATTGPKKESSLSASTSKKHTAAGRSNTESRSNDRKPSASDSGSAGADGSSKKESKSDS
ncbi:hypothetical protein [Mycobacterium sp. DL99]|uniref:hypothetical protein n=1 Tax=Mycobacterium sp. DL99 TaxID=2528957 RepID=UPI0010817823|nr:hypothetical protein [Mycobacterium sp. DL99]